MKAHSYSTARRTLATALFVALLGSAAAAQPTADGTADGDYAADFERAHAAYERNHWHEAYAAFAALADRGHAESARIALQMVRRGPALYGSTFHAGDEQLRRWAWLVSCTGGSNEPACSLAQRAP